MSLLFTVPAWGTEKIGRGGLNYLLDLVEDAIDSALDDVLLELGEPLRDGRVVDLDRRVVRLVDLTPVLEVVLLDERVTQKQIDLLLLLLGGVALLVRQVAEVPDADRALQVELRLAPPVARGGGERGLAAG